MMRDKDNRRRVAGCGPDQGLLEAFLEEKDSLEKKAFRAHALSCRSCRQKMELIEELRAELAGPLARLPESPLGRKKDRLLRQAAQNELERLIGPPSRSLRPRLFTFWRLAAAALMLAAAFGLTFLLNRSLPKDIYRGAPQATQEKMSPQGALREKPSLFEWSPVSGATRYSFELINENLEMLAQGQRSSKVNFALPPEVVQRLERGRVYVWTVKAYDDEGSEVGSRSAEFNIQ